MRSVDLSSCYSLLVVFFIVISSVLCQDTFSSTTKNAIEDESLKISLPVSNFPSSTPSLRYDFTTSPRVPQVPQVSIVPSPVPPKPPKLVCPGPEVPRPFFTLRCSSTKDCELLGKGILCCSSRCIKGVPPPKPEPVHEPSWFGLVDRTCPSEPIPEIWEIKQCISDAECGSRICCSETLLNGTVIGFCRIASPKFDRVPAARRIVEPIMAVMSYMQCTPPPPPVLDIFPKPCNSPLDCFPNLCCQEKGKRYCRPPKRSLLSLVAGISQRIIPNRTARRLIERIAS